MSFRHVSQGRVNLKNWLRKLGFWGLVFFVLKGLLWLAIPTLVALFTTD
jgi:hypothetical protein